MIRPDVSELLRLGSFPPSTEAKAEIIKRQQELLDAIVAPVTDPEALELLKLFGPDDYYGLAWTVLHLIEGAPHWPLPGCLSDLSNPWIRTLAERIERK